MSQAVEKLVQAATAMVNAGQWEQGEKAWHEVNRLQPNHPKALFALGFHAYRRGELGVARRWLDACVSHAPKDMLAWLTLASVVREQADLQEEGQCLTKALAVDPYHLPAMLLMADWHERAGQKPASVALYRNALKVAPHRSQWPESLRPQLSRAAVIVQRHSDALINYLDEHLTLQMATLPPPQQSRWREAVSIFSGHSKPYVAQCNQLTVPRLPAIPFFEREQFPWLAQLEAKTDVIREELVAVLATAQNDFSPYIAYQPGQPVNQWADLNHSQRWSAFHLWRGGEEVQENTARCPQTADLLRQGQLAEIAGLCPNVLFSALAPHTHIPPHHGETNARLVAHLPLVVPPKCYLRVGYEQREWRVGETLIFDDCLEHEARNDSDELRVVLIFDLWNPLLSNAERQMVQAMTAAMRTFNA